MSINSISCIQSMANKNSKASPLTEIILTNPYNPGPHNPNAYFSAQSAIVRNSANNQITACSCTITNQTGNYHKEYYPGRSVQDKDLMLDASFLCWTRRGYYTGRVQHNFCISCVLGPPYNWHYLNKELLSWTLRPG